jgi:hypothetical protein
MDREPSGLGTRIAWRFAALYLVLYLLPFPFDAPFEPPGAPPWYAKIWDPAVAALGHTLGVRGSLSTVDGPDAPGHYVQLVCFGFLAAAAATAWSLLDRPRPRDRIAHEALRACVRYALAAAMLAFGFAKLFTTQMPLPEPSQLLETYGHSSRMALLWTFMGASPAYERLAGAVEVLGGALLLTGGGRASCTPTAPARRSTSRPVRHPRTGSRSDQEGGTFTLARAGDGTLTVDGTIEGEPVTVRTRPTDAANLALLLKPGFAWVK